MRTARHNLLAIWHADDFRARCASIRIVRRQLVLANTPDAVKHVMATQNANFERKSPQMRRALEFLIGDGLFISDGETWAARRPLVADIVHKRRVPAFGPAMEHVAHDLVARWQARSVGEPFDCLAEMGELTAGIIARTVFGSTLTPEAAFEVIDGFAHYQTLIDNFNPGYFLGFNEGLPVLRGPRLRTAIRRVHSVIDRVVNDHLEGRGSDNSMVDLLVKRQQKSPDLGLDATALRNEAATIFMAGHETTAATLTWAWYLLARAPWVEAAVHAEIDRVCGGRTPTVDDVGALDWCRAVIEETLRLYPPIAIMARQTRDRDRIAGIDVEPASLVLIVPWLLHRSPDLWEHPDRFMPERFLGPERPPPYTYIPFAAGPRVCAGVTFGMTESILSLAIIAQLFRVRVAADARVEPVSRLSLRPAHGLPVTIEARG